jgi:triacylglycerol lipase
MSILGLIEGGAPQPQDGLAVRPELHLQVEDALASGKRLWVRGRISNLLLPLPLPSKRRWWKRWKADHSNGQLPAAPWSEKASLTIRVSGATCTADVSPEPDGRFDAMLNVDFPPDRPGWRAVRYRATVDDRAAEASGIVLRPGAAGDKAIVVILPRDYTLTASGLKELANSRKAPHVAEILRAVQAKPRGMPPVFYLACVLPSGGASAAELALAATALGWPSGDFVLLPGTRGGESAAVAQALDRLRWLFADTLELDLVNLEPLEEAALPTLTAAKEDRAAIRVLKCPESSPGGHRPRLSYNQITAVRPSRAGLIPRHPVVFCHGMLAFSMLKRQIPEHWNCFSPLRDILRERGVPVLLPQVPPTSGVKERAEQLRDQIRSWTSEPVNLIAHSMGGLDARYMISRLDMADQVASLTTVSTPHRGSYLADWFLANYRQRVPLLLALEMIGVNVDGFKDCRPAVCRKFNEETPDSPKVRYFSYGGDVPQSRLSPFLRRAWNVLTPVEGPNDGMVSVASARWGEYLGSIHADHFAQTPDATFLREGEDFDSLGFFAHLVEELAHRGF